MAMNAQAIRELALVVVLAGFFSPGATVRQVIRADEGRANLLRADAWQPWEQGFERQGNLLVCANGDDTKVQRGAGQTVVLDQDRPQPIVATAWSRAEAVTGSRNSDYSLYLDILYADGTPQWGQIKAFDVGTHDWQKARVFFFPSKPIKSVSYYLLLRRHGGTAWFRDAELHELSLPAGAGSFDGVPVLPGESPAEEGFMVRDVAADSDFVDAAGAEAMGLRVETRTTAVGNAEFVDLSVTDTTGNDRALVAYYRVPVPADTAEWLGNPVERIRAEAGREYAETASFAAGANGRLSRYPVAAAAGPAGGLALGYDPAFPAFGRIAYNHDARELFVACDVGLTKEKPAATFRFVRFPFVPAEGFRAAWAAYMGIFPEAFRCRTPRQGLWMPFAKISEVKGWEDFGFVFKEGDNETAWDDANRIVTFRYTEPMTWWMRMPKETPRTFAAALAHAEAIAGDPAHRQHRQARALLASGYHDEHGRLMALLRDTPWCDGAVWSMNSMPGIAGEITDFKLKWSPELRERLYGPARKADLDGEYIDSSEGYVTGELDFRRDHFAAADRPLTFSLDSRKPAIFRGLVAFEYARGIERDIHAMDKLMMANSTPSRLWWLAPLLDVLGTETNWNHGGKWRPMSHADLAFRRTLCGPKPYCFLMNTKFEDFGHDLVEKYMKRALAYGMFPGFFSADASTGHYFRRPELYDRDRDLFQRYVPVCRQVAEAGWRPVAGASAGNEKVYLERFGDRYLTVFNDADQPQDIAIRVSFAKGAPRDLLGKACAMTDGVLRLRLEPEDVAVLDFAAPKAP